MTLTLRMFGGERRESRALDEIAVFDRAIAPESDRVPARDVRRVTDEERPGSRSGTLLWAKSRRGASAGGSPSTRFRRPSSEPAFS
jgi:hypothetical protein